MIDHLANITDVADLLPTEAAVKLHRIRHLRDDPRSILRGLVEQTMDARQARTVAVERLKHIKQPPTGRSAGDDHPAVITAQRSLDAANAELARLQQHEAVISATFNTRDRLVINIERFLRDAASTGKVIVQAVAVEPRQQKGEGIFDAIERVRRQGRTIAADIHTIASAPVPSADAKRRMRAQIEDIASLGRPSVSGLIEDPAGKLEFAQLDPLARPARYIGATEPDALALMIWLHRDALIARLDAEIAEEASDEAALSEVDRARKTKELEGDATLCARQLAALIWKARDENLTVEFDEDADVLAVLGITVVDGAARQVGRDRTEEVLRQRRAVQAAEPDAVEGEPTAS